MHELGCEPSSPDLPSLFSIKEKLAISQILRDNRKMGVLRVEQYRLSSMLEEMAWVFSSMCTGGLWAGRDEGKG